ncbi:hypothetical protein HOT72_gp076 [Gordonia phage Apricot]|uniref:Uncharacterized protein n=1 Tax=Gordonia phage Apricot TaxID=2250319 RepID=A0A345L183_9CAUD|nr:hypothetical protein HOT72_gp076 [Gordonia phage Apricot]AXH49035.1 hypothetical protein SEA_APRICOT_76 [Gordonia phage Apricot]
MSDIGFGPVGDPPIIYDTERTDGYGRVTRLVDRRLLEQAQARIKAVEAFAHSLMEDEVTGDSGLDRESEGIIVEHSRMIGSNILDALNGAAERDRWKAAYEKTTHALPEPDAGNPAHWRFAADLIPGDWRLRSGDTAVSGIIQREADRLESEATADDAVEKAAQAYWQTQEDFDWDTVTDDDKALVRDGVRAALHSAGLLRGDR